MKLDLNMGLSFGLSTGLGRRRAETTAAAASGPSAIQAVDTAMVDNGEAGSGTSLGLTVTAYFRGTVKIETPNMPIDVRTQNLPKRQTRALHLVPLPLVGTTINVQLPLVNNNWLPLRVQAIAPAPASLAWSPLLAPAPASLAYLTPLLAIAPPPCPLSWLPRSLSLALIISPLRWTSRICACSRPRSATLRPLSPSRRTGAPWSASC